MAQNINLYWMCFFISKLHVIHKSSLWKQNHSFRSTLNGSISKARSSIPRNDSLLSKLHNAFSGSKSALGSTFSIFGAGKGHHPPKRQRRSSRMSNMRMSHGEEQVKFGIISSYSRDSLNISLFLSLTSPCHHFFTISDKEKNSSSIYITISFTHTHTHKHLKNVHSYSASHGFG